MVLLTRNTTHGAADKKHHAQFCFKKRRTKSVPVENYSCYPSDTSSNLPISLLQSMIV